MKRMIALVLFVALGVAGSAAAQAPDPADFVLRPGATGLPARVNELAKHLERGTVDRILAEANRPATANGGCSEAAFGAMPPGSRWYCFDPTDTGDIERPDAVEWIPQGVTTSGDAGGGREALLVSWYDKRTAPAKGVRVSFLDAATNRYRHVLLVYPTADGAYEIVGRPQGGIHAGGIVWRGNLLYVVDTTRGIRVFDLRQVFDLARSPAGDTGDKSRIGRHGDTYHGFGYRYVMPQVGAWVNAAGPDDDGDFTCEATGAPKFSSIALDAGEQRLVTSEYCRSGAFGRVARWPLGADDLLAGPEGTVRVADARRLPVHQVQGAVTQAGTWYLSRSRGADTNGQLIPATPGPAGSLQAGEPRRAGIGPETSRTGLAVTNSGLSPSTPAAAWSTACRRSPSHAPGPDGVDQRGPHAVGRARDAADRSARFQGFHRCAPRGPGVGWPCLCHTLTQGGFDAETYQSSGRPWPVSRCGRRPGRSPVRTCGSNTFTSRSTRAGSPATSGRRGASTARRTASRPR